VDWHRIASSGKDLAGTGGKPRPVTASELALHKSRDDIWMAIRGHVFNITPYMDFHPGGRAQLMRGAGKDATILFNGLHAWVNFEFMLKSCYVGPLVPDADGTTAVVAKLNEVYRDYH
jgi:cytochrome-b5 reductase